MDKIEEVKKIIEGVFSEGINRMRSHPAGTIFPEYSLLEIAEQICQLFEPKPNQTYTLNCDCCGTPFNSVDGFPKIQLCPECLKPDQSRLPEELNHLFCQHCKALQKTNDTAVDCWYNPMDEEKRLAFCAANLGAVMSIVAKTASIVYDEGYDDGRGFAKAECQAKIEALIEQWANCIDSLTEFYECSNGGCKVYPKLKKVLEDFEAKYRKEKEDDK